MLLIISNKYDYDDDDGDGDDGGGDDWLVVSNIFIFHYIWDNPSHWLAYFSGGWNHQKTERLTRGWYRLVRAAPTDSVGTISLEVSKVMVALKPRKVVEHFHANQRTSWVIPLLWSLSFSPRFVGHQPSRTSNLRPGFPGSYIPYSISGVITKRHNWHFGIGPWFRKLPVTEVVQLAIL